MAVFLGARRSSGDTVKPHTVIADRFAAPPPSFVESPVGSVPWKAHHRSRSGQLQQTGHFC
ncbi:hypothetical protein EYF80_037335 [Liparis tanakae]|uniref:Uncharacterized protein n=1 Tax=Liparis tanakae TaxID=230148 RepID=A0A4Z2GH26_9TELE|nr:hypothetical protein EYF80_037335 [Liparis tanakae]